MFRPEDGRRTKFSGVEDAISTAASSSSKSSTLIFGDEGHSISRPGGDNAVDLNEWGDTESLPEEYPQSEDEDNVLADGLPVKCDVDPTDVGNVEELL